MKARQAVRRLLAAAALAIVLCPGASLAQESRIAAEFRREGEQLRENCSALSSTLGCATTVVTGRPLHLSLGSIAPGNGMAFGASFGTRHNPSENWRFTWSADTVRSVRGAWRAGAYMKMIHTPESVITVVTDVLAASTGADLAPRPHMVIDLFAESTSLQRVSFYLPQDAASRATFGLHETNIGAGIIAPLARAGALNLALTGEASVRRFSLRDGTDPDAPGIFSVYDDTLAPGLVEAPDFLHLRGGVRLQPAVGRYVRLNYLVSAQHFAGGSEFSFQRFTLDLDHEIAFYGTSRPVETRATNTPNDCTISPSSDVCPSVSVSRDRRGSVNLRVFAVSSRTGEDARVPFYLQPTLGGRDINGSAALESFDDYRFRGPHALLFQQTFEHSVWGPVGAWIRTDQGMVASRRGGLRMSGLHKSVAGGITIRAGAFPMVVASYAAGGGEGRHFSLTINTSLLGGSNRPALD